MAQFIIKTTLVYTSLPVNIPLPVLLNPRLKLNDIPRLQGSQFLKPFCHIEPEMIGYYFSVIIADRHQQDRLGRSAFIAGFQTVFSKCAPKQTPMIVQYF